MSQTATHAIQCRCGATVEVFCADSINAERHPHMRDAILARTLHVFRCEACLGMIAVDKELLYLDLARKQMYAVHPPGERADERAHGDALIEEHALAIGERAGAAARALFDGDNFHVRLCYGLEELREKLVAQDAGLRDLPLEALKVRVLAEHAELARLAVIALRFDGLAADGKLAFVGERATDPPTLLAVGLTVERSRYDELAALTWQATLAAFPGLAAGPHVSMLRWAADPAAPGVP